MECYIIRPFVLRIRSLLLSPASQLFRITTSGSGYALFQRRLYLFIAAFNVLGYSTLRLSSWLNNQYALNLRKRWKIIMIYIAVTLLFLLLNYSLLIVGKLLVGSYNIFIFPMAVGASSFWCGW